MLVIRYDWRNNSVLFVHNLDEKPREVSFAVGLGGEAGKLLVNLLSEDHSHADERANTRCCSKPMAIAGIGSAASTICLSAATSTPTQTGKTSHPA